MDYASWYRKISAPFQSARARRALRAADASLVALFAAGYCAELALLAAQGDPRLLKFACVPAATFAIATAARSVLDRPRPYDAFAIEPILSHDAHGKSMPSKHVASAVAIACAFCWIDMRIGGFALAASALVAASRVVGGVHFPRDVVAAALLALACSAAGFILAP